MGEFTKNLDTDQNKIDFSDICDEISSSVEVLDCEKALHYLEAFTS